MNTLPWMLMALLTASPAFAQGEDQSEPEATTEGDSQPEGVPEEATGPEAEAPAAVAEPDTEAEAPAEAPEPEATPAPAPEPEPEGTAEPAATPEPVADAAPKEDAPAPEPKLGVDHKATALAAPQLVLFLGGQQIAAMDPGFGALGDRDNLQSFNWGLDIWLHPNLGLAMSWSDSGALADNLSDELGTTQLRVEARIRSADISAKAMLAPRWLPIRPVARVGVGVHAAHMTITDNNQYSNLQTRTYDAAAPYLRLAGGLEITSPRYFGKGARDKNARKKLRHGGGFSIEAGAQIGGGGDHAAAPSLNLGVPGRLDVGPWTFRAGALIFF